MKGKEMQYFICLLIFGITLDQSCKTFTRVYALKWRDLFYLYHLVVLFFLHSETIVVCLSEGAVSQPVHHTENPS